MNKWRTLAGAWFETFITFELVLHAKDLIKPGLLIQAALAAFLPIAIRWIDPKDKFPDGE
jgi:hypothetical protein